MDYKKDKFYIGFSDFASLTLRFPNKAEVLDFGIDDAYSAYFITDDTEIPSHYHKVASGEHWCNIYDDTRLTTTIFADMIDFYRAGETGALIVAKGGSAYLTNV